MLAMLLFGACRTGGEGKKQEDAHALSDQGEAPPIERPDNPSEEACATPFMSIDANTCDAQTSQT